jgi:hypothetical protein
MFERALNAFWILLGAAAAAYAWTLGLVGPSGPESGLFPLIGMPYLGFAATGAVTMIILLRTVEQSSWTASIALALGSVAAVLWLFGHVLGMVLPRGPWGF